MRDLQRARSAKFPAQQSPSVSDKRKTRQAFFASRLPIRLRAVRDLQRARSAKFPAQLATSTECEVPRAAIACVSDHKAHRKHRALCPHKESQSRETAVLITSSKSHPSKNAVSLRARSFDRMPRKHMRSGFSHTYIDCTS